MSQFSVTKATKCLFSCGTNLFFLLFAFLPACLPAFVWCWKIHLFQQKCNKQFILINHTPKKKVFHFVNKNKKTENFWLEICVKQLTVLGKVRDRDDSTNVFVNKMSHLERQQSSNIYFISTSNFTSHTTCLVSKLQTHSLVSLILCAPSNQIVSWK